MTTSTMPADPRTLNCPSWCQTDHAQEWAVAVEHSAETARLMVELGRSDQGRPMPESDCPPFHRRALGTVTVRVGDGTQTDQLDEGRRAGTAWLPGVGAAVVTADAAGSAGAGVAVAARRRRTHP